MILVLLHHETIHTGKCYLMLHHLAGATIQVAKVVDYNCHSFRGWQLLHQIITGKNLYLKMQVLV